MEVICTPMRLYVEPIRLILKAANINFKEKPSTEELKFINIFNEGCCSTSGYDDTVEYVNSLYFRSDKWLNTTDSSDKSTINNKILREIKALYIEIADVIAADKPLSFFSEASLRKYTRMVADGGFLSGNKWTPADAFFYEIIKILEAMNFKLRDSEIYKYVERFHAVQYLRPYIFDDNTYTRPFSANLKSIVTTTSEVLQKKLSSLCYFAMCEGMMMASRKKVVDNEELVEFADHMPFNSYPKKVSKEEVSELLSIQKDWNVLLNSMARDFDWYSELLKEMVEKEDFVRRLYEISKKCRAYPHTQKVSLVVSRNDYMYNSKDNRWLQVEYNTIAAGLMPSSDSVQKLHKHVNQNLFDAKDLEFEKSQNMELLKDALLAGYKAYSNKKAVALLIIPNAFEANMFDQRRVEKSLFENGIDCLRVTLEEVYNNSEFDESTGTLYVHGQEVGLVYFRAGYIPEHYYNEDTWKAREIIEMSRAVKCPNIDSQMINFKIFQVYLAKDHVLENFIPEEAKRKQFQKNFAQFWDFEDYTKIPEILAMVESNPSLYVLKPQREGGANNYFDHEIVDMIKNLSPEEISTYLLMEKIDSSPHIGYFVRNKQMNIMPCTSELGVFAYVLSDSEKILESKVGGTLVRSKPSCLSEGGLARGYGVIDSFVYE